MQELRPPARAEDTNLVVLVEVLLQGLSHPGEITLVARLAAALAALQRVIVTTPPSVTMAISRRRGP
jgi:hypothetical protein